MLYGDRLRAWTSERAPLWPHFAPLIALSAPNLLGIVLELGLPFATLVCVGKDGGTAELGSFVLANMFVNAFGLSIVNGLAMGLDSLAPMSFGANGVNPQIGALTQRMICVVWAFCIPVAGMFLLSPMILRSLLRIEIEPAKLASTFIYLQIPLLPAIGFFEVFRRYLQSMRLVWPTTLSASIAFLTHVPTTIFLTSRFGLNGAAIALVVTRTMACFSLVVIVLVRERYTASPIAASWPRPKMKEMFSGWPQVLRYAAPASASLFLEWGGYELYASIAAQIGDSETSLAAMGIVANAAYILFAIPAALCSGAGTLCGNYLGARNTKNVRAVLVLCLLLVLAIAVIGSVASFLLRNQFGRLFSSDPQVVDLVSSVLKWFWIYHLLDKFQAFGSALLRGTARPTMTLIFLVLAVILMGFPLAYFLSHEMGLLGVWMAMACAWGVCAVAFFIILLLSDWDALCDSVGSEMSLHQEGEEQEVHLSLLTDGETNEII